MGGCEEVRNKRFECRIPKSEHEIQVIMKYKGGFIGRGLSFRQLFAVGAAVVLTLILIAGCGKGNRKAYEIGVSGMSVSINDTAVVSGIRFTGLNEVRNIKAFTRMAECEPAGRAKVRRSDGTVSFSRKWVSRASGNSCIVTDRFMPGNGSLRWEVEVAGQDGPWSTPIETILEYPNLSEARFWTSWGDPRLGAIKKADTEQQAKLGILPLDVNGSWTDPLVPIPFVDDTLWFGAPPFRYEKPGIAFCPFQGNLFGIPLLTLSEEKTRTGISLVLSPEDTFLDLNLQTESSGKFTFSREAHRIRSGKVVRFAMDLVVHESGWRGGLRWMSGHYPAFFNPNIARADSIAGTGAYSSLETAFDKAKMDRMAFGVNWKASFDFPYMGMFIPPVESDTVRWPRYGGGTTSIADLRKYAAGMRNLGYHVLSYFNVTEFGAEVTDPKPPRKAVDDRDLWKSADDFLYYRLGDAILHVPAAVPAAKLSFYPRSRPDGPYYTWGNGIIMDPGEPVYRDYLLDQARRHIDLIPDAEGICIDRMDWLRMYNEQRDDSVSWFGGQPTRSLLMSWKSLLDRLGPLMHIADKVIFVNNHDKRIDLLRETDGFFDEFTYRGSPLNLTALMGVRKPVLGWTGEEKDLRPDPDAFFQRYLYLGVYPTAPFPGNDHSLLPGEWVDRQYLDYGPLLRMLKGKKWVLEPDCIIAEGNAAKVNLFTTPEGYVIPVMFGPTEGIVRIIVKGVKGVKGVKEVKGVRAEAVYPGNPEPSEIKLVASGEELVMEVPLHRGCAMVRILLKRNLPPSA